MDSWIEEQLYEDRHGFPRGGVAGPVACNTVRPEGVPQTVAISEQDYLWSHDGQWPPNPHELHNKQIKEVIRHYEAAEEQLAKSRRAFSEYRKSFKQYAAESRATLAVRDREIAELRNAVPISPCCSVECVRVVPMASIDGDYVCTKCGRDYERSQTKAVSREKA